ncbi:DUF3087 family protein [Motilimonas pumila]|uniref:DUF3087 domain-containing protein n=1 Tax=Motilimonas pumila TaxID=2303987 RepID=A0A418YCR1_9GAMM|nr:DUF3087 family protein [Motilimonas pumila]RJG42310.1 DUF3087 domain-containing protein [Motilimonas pumila]
MTLIEIDKPRYRQRLNRIIFACIAILVVVSLGASSVMIHFWGSDSNFILNLAGVVLAGFVVLQLLRSLRNHPYMHEVMYVWDLKQQLNLINRKYRPLLAAAKKGDERAMQVLHFSYVGSEQLWQLDDNTITIDELKVQMQTLQALADEQQVTLDSSVFDVAWLTDY